MRQIILFLFLALTYCGYSQKQTILNVNVADMVYDDSRNKLFAIIGSTDTKYGNTLLQINCESKQIEKQLFVGSEPDLIKMTSDNNYLYIALRGTPKIVRVNIVDFKKDMEFLIGPIGNSVDIYAAEIETIFGNSDLLAVSRSENDYVRDVVIFNKGEVQPNKIERNILSATEIESNDAGDMLYGFNGGSSRFDFGRMEVSAKGLIFKDKFEGVMSGFGLQMYYVGGLLYSNTGSVVNPYLSVPYSEGTFGNVETYNTQMAIRSQEKETYFGTFDFWSNAFRVRRYNIETYSLKDVKELDLIFPETMHSAELLKFICYQKDKFIVAAQEDYFPDENEKYIIFIDGFYDESTLSNPVVANKKVVSLYPNPAKDVLYIKQSGDFSVNKIDVFNVLGEKIKTFTSDLDRLNLTNMVDGLYIFKFYSTEGNFQEKIVIRK